MNPPKRIAITLGEPAGIGPDILLQMAQINWPHELVVFSSPNVLNQRAEILGLPIKLTACEFDQTPEPHQSAQLKIVPITECAPVEPGILNPANAPYVLETLNQATKACLDRQCDALVTGPIHKGVINDFGLPFTGHTEYLANLCHIEKVVMMLATDALRVALVSTHLPLCEVPSAITKEAIITTIRTVDTSLKQHFNIRKPTLLVAGLNPHAGEQGHLGREEIDIIQPALESLRKEGLTLVGPLPADTLFTPHNLKDADAVITMYHDQGLPVLKYQGFGKAINITLGLPIIRTSVDHGTALPLAGSGKARADSLECAIKQAIEMSRP